MGTPGKTDKSIIYFFMIYALAYMNNAVFGTFYPVYLKGIGFTKSNIGMILALGPFIAILGQPLWGKAADRAKTKNTILLILFIGNAATMIFYPLSDKFYYILIITALFMFFQTSVSPMSDAITLEYLDGSQYRFGPIRMSGTIGYALMAIAAGMAARHNIKSIFPLYFIISLIVSAVVLRMPVIEGHQTKDSNTSLKNLLNNHEIIALLSFNFIVQSTIGFYSNFFSIYYGQMGADNGLLGWAMFISAFSEVPFLLFADKILDRIGIYNTILLSSVSTAVRWALLSIAGSKLLVLALQAMHGSSYIVLSYSMATYINRAAPRELKASGQAMNGLFIAGLSRIAGSILGGFLSDAFGIKRVLLYNSILVMGTVIIFGIIFRNLDAKNIDRIQQIS